MRANALVLLLALTPLCAQEIRFPESLNRLAAKSIETVDVTLDATLLQLAGRFLSAQKPDEAKAKKLVSGLKGIYVKSFEFEREGEYTQADVEAVRSQIRGPEWSRIVGVVSRRDKENAEVFLKTEQGRVTGVVILATEPKQFTFVNIVGTVELDDLSELGGHFGIPRVEVERQKPGKD